MSRKSTALTISKDSSEVTTGPITLIPEQGRLLSEAMNEPIEEHAIDVRQGPKGTMLKYVKHGYVTDMLNKVFGPFWSFRAIDVLPGQKYSIVEYTVERQNQRTHVTDVIPVKEILVMGELRVRIYAVGGATYFRRGAVRFGRQGLGKEHYLCRCLAVGRIRIVKTGSVPVGSQVRVGTLL